MNTSGLGLPFGPAFCPYLPILGLSGHPSPHCPQKSVGCNDPCSHPYLPSVWQVSYSIAWTNYLTKHREQVIRGPSVSAGLR